MSGQAGDGRILVLLHGLGANRHVWDGVAELWDGEVYAPDFRGHGEAPWRGHYSFGAMAADVAETLQRDFGTAPYAVVGHSMGGAVGLALASGWFGPPPTHVATIGVKLRWSDEELSRIGGLAARPPRMFDDRDGAVEWFMKLSGLFGVFAPDDPRLAATIDTGVITDQASGAVGADSLWRTTQDPATVGVGPAGHDGLATRSEVPGGDGAGRTRSARRPRSSRRPGRDCRGEPARGWCSRSTCVQRPRPQRHGGGPPRCRSVARDPSCVR